jgi:trans-2,3-dihydro-3-hydroxyanthranilate isomerase
VKKKIYQVDAFTDTIFGGNPAGVVLDGSNLSDLHMKKIANEMALSETAFVFRSNDPEYDYQIRFFTPTEEVALCGHATIATFFLMAKLGMIDSQKEKIVVRQKTLAGILPVEIIFKNNKISRVMMTQAKPKHIHTFTQLDEIASIMGIGKSDIGLKDFHVLPMIYSTGLPDIMLPVKDIETLKKIKPDFSKLALFTREKKVTGVHAFAIESVDNNVVVCRNFAPACGINEEAATGTSNGALGAYLIENGIIKCEKSVDILFKQGYFMNRPSQIYVNVIKNNNELEIKVGGKAVLSIEGKIYLT